MVDKIVEVGSDKLLNISIFHKYQYQSGTRTNLEKLSVGKILCVAVKK